MPVYRALAVALGGVLLATCSGAPGSPTVPPTPEPPPTTTTTLPPNSQGCGLPASRGQCGYDNSTFVPQINEAIARVQRERPELFDFSQGHDAMSFLVRDVDRYHEEVVRVLRAVGLCARFDGEEIAIKNTNDFSDQYDIITANNFVRWGDGAYAATCRPAVF